MAGEQEEGVSVTHHGNLNLTDDHASVSLQQYVFLPARSDRPPTTSFDFGSSNHSSGNVLSGRGPLHHHRQYYPRTAMTCRDEIRQRAESCIGIIEQALLIVESMEDESYGDHDRNEWIFE